MQTPKSKSPKSNPSSPMKMSSIPFKNKDDTIMKAMLRLVEVKDIASKQYIKLDVISAKPLSDITISEYTFKILKREIESLLSCKDPLLSLIIEASVSKLPDKRFNILQKKYGIAKLNYNFFSSTIYKNILEKYNIIDASDIKKYLRTLLENIELIPKYINMNSE